MILFPDRALPSEIVTPSSDAVQKFGWQFQPWCGTMPTHKFGDGKKPLVAWEGKPLYAELAMIAILKNHGFAEAIWRDNFGRGYFRNALPPASCTMPECFREVCGRILAVNGSWSGCWDVLAMDREAPIFVECKWKTKDRIKQSQKQWFESALTAGLSPEQFAICEWSFA